jgi:carboxypeptidase D
MGFNDSFLANLADQDEKCGYAQYRQDFMQFPPNGTQPPLYFNATDDPDCDLWDLVYDTAYSVNPCFNVYEPNLQCPLLSDPLGFPSDLIYSYPGLPPYFNRTDVKKALHVPVDSDWALCTGPVFVGEGGPEDLGDSSLDPIQAVLPRIIEATNRVLVYVVVIPPVVVALKTQIKQANQPLIQLQWRVRPRRARQRHNARNPKHDVERAARVPNRAQHNHLH